MCQKQPCIIMSISTNEYIGKHASRRGNSILVVLILSIKNIFIVDAKVKVLVYSGYIYINYISTDGKENKLLHYSIVVVDQFIFDQVFIFLCNIEDTAQVDTIKEQQPIVIVRDGKRNYK